MRKTVFALSSMLLLIACASGGQRPATAPPHPVGGGEPQPWARLTTGPLMDWT